MSRIHPECADSGTSDRSIADVIGDQHSGRTRVTPIFTWLQAHRGVRWVTELLRLSEGIEVTEALGEVISLSLGKERTVAPSVERLAWMIRNAHKLAPKDGRQWQEYWPRVIDNPKKEEALRKLDAGDLKRIRRN